MSLQSFIRPLAFGFIGLIAMALPDSALADRKKSGRGSDRHYHQSSRHHHYDKSSHRHYYKHHHHRYRHHDRWHRGHYYDRPNYYYDPPRRGITIRF